MFETAPIKDKRRRIAWLSSLSHPPCAKTTIIKDTKGGKSISALSRLTAVGTCPMTPTQPALQNHVTWVQCVQCGKIHFFFIPSTHINKITISNEARTVGSPKPCWWNLEKRRWHQDHQNQSNIWGQELVSIHHNITKTCVVETLPLKYTSKRLKRREGEKSKEVKKGKNQETIKSKYYWQQGVGVLCHVTNTQNTNIQSKSK